jgi:hypothetical protein
MKTQLLTVLAVWLVLGAAAACADEPDAKAILDKATRAMNGEGKLARFGAGSLKGKLTATEGGQQITADLDGTWQGTSQYRADLDIQEGGKNFKGVLVLNGDKGWFKEPDKTEDAPEGAAAFLREILYAGRMPLLLPGLAGKDYKVSLLGEVKVGNRTAVGLSVSHRDHKDVSLFFDKESGLPLKSEVRLTNPQGKEVTLEYLYGDYKDFDGVKLPAKVTIKLEDKEVTLDVSEVKPADKVDAGLFDKP